MKRQIHTGNIPSILNRILPAIFLTLFSWACDTNVLDKVPLDRFSDEAVWKDAALTEAFVNNTYRIMPQGHTSGAQMLASVTDEAYYRTGRPDYISAGNITPAELGVLNFWTLGGEAGANYSYWGVITKCNIFFDNISASPIEETQKQRMIGEMKSLRAYAYFRLVAFFGGVPLITKSFTLNDDFNVARNSYSECMDFVVNELTEAASLLPVAYSGENKGRINKGAALAMKSRALLYMASPLNNAAQDRTRWEKAAAAAKEVIDLKIYSLFPNYKDQFLKKNLYNQESIWVRPFNYAVDPEGANVEQTLYPNGYNGFGQSSPLQNMVDAYEMTSGKLPKDDPSYDPQNPYVNRDPRFYASVLYDGAPFQHREVETFLPGGLDTQEGPVSSWNATLTGYYFRKFIDETIVNPGGVVRGDSPWIYFRYAEILLNYAEASYFLGNEQTAREYLNMVRNRPGVEMPPVTESGSALFERIVNERRVELAFEEHRYFDVRRLKIAPDVLNRGGARMNIRKDPVTGKKTYQVQEFTTKRFYEKNYLVPIPQSEIEKNPLLEQNPGY